MTDRRPILPVALILLAVVMFASCAGMLPRSAPPAVKAPYAAITWPSPLVGALADPADPSVSPRAQRKIPPAARDSSAPATTRSKTPDQPTGSVPDLIRSYFPSWAEAKALCVGRRESRFHPDAYNPSSGATGVFQFLIGTWLHYAPRAGWGGASRLSARANVAVAAWAVTHDGWGPWEGPGC